MLGLSERWKGLLFQSIGDVQSIKEGNKILLKKEIFSPSFLIKPRPKSALHLLIKQAQLDFFAMLPVAVFY